MPIKRIISNLSSFKSEEKIKNSNYKNRYKELKAMVNYCCDVWNNVFYARKKIQQPSTDFDPRFYYQSIIFNLYMLGLITKRIGTDILESDISLQDLRNNIAHMDEKLKNPLNFIHINELKAGTVTEEAGRTLINVSSLIGLNIDTNNTISSPLGIVGDIVFSSLEPTPELSKYTKFVSYEITQEKLDTLQEKLLNLLNSYFDNIRFE